MRRHGGGVRLYEKEPILRWLTTSLALACAAGLGISGAAHAHWRAGVYLGAPAYYGPVVPAPYYYPPYYYSPYPPYPPPVVVTPDDYSDPAYIERSQVESEDSQDESQPPAGTWWYCAKTKTYYPYVKQCASGWREVPATPPAPSR